MGAAQSNERVGRDTLYEILGLNENATETELKLAYKRRALALHPDRNYDNEQEATMQFAKVQAAYDILSDPQERAWYDSHHDGTGYTEYNAKVTRTGELKEYLSPGIVKQYQPSTGKFFQSVKDLFERLKNEELEAAFDQGVYAADVPVANAPGFGNEHTEWPAVKQFYDVWAGFATIKSFSWEDVFPLHHADDRRSRRAMDSRNKKIREPAKREFNDAVRQLVQHIRRYDPRVAKQQEFQRKKNDARLKERPRTKENLVYEAQEWSEVQPLNESEHDDNFEGEGDDFECIACDKQFKSKQQLSKHELTSKHAMALQKLQLIMEREEAEFGLTESSPHAGLYDGTGVTTPQVDHDSDDDVQKTSSSIKYLSVEDIMSQMDGHKGRGKHERSAPDSSVKPVGKAKQKRMQKQKAVSGFALKCGTCQTTFVSQNQLFEHMQMSRHAPLPTIPR